MRLHLVFVGKTSFPDLDTAIQRYLDRLRRYVTIEVHTVRAEKILNEPKTADDIKEKEGERILKLVGNQGYLVVWDERGKELDSVQFARTLDRFQNEGASSVWMVTGGPLGLSPKVRQAADVVLALSRMTFPHDLARLMLVEQLYRAFSILRGEPYHK